MSKSKSSFWWAAAIWVCALGMDGAHAQTPAEPPACKTPLDARIENSCIVDAGVLWRGAKPTKAAAAALVEQGVQTVVNLEWLHEDIDAFEDASLADAGKREIEYFRVVDWEPLVVIAPKKVDDNIAKFIAITRSQPKPIYVHCRAGRNRTSVMVAAYRVFNGMSIEDAIAEMGRYQGEWFSQDAKYIRTLTPERIAAIERKVLDWIPKLKREAIFVCEGRGCKTDKH